MNAMSPPRDFSPAMAGEIMETLILKGDLKYLTPKERVDYHNTVCGLAGINPLTRPFGYIELNGKLTLYAFKACTDQLRHVHGVSVTSLTEADRDGVHIVTAHVKDRNGRTDVARGAVSVMNLKGEALANALMKAETKAKRRATLSICGLGFLDETEVEDIPASAKREPPVDALPPESRAPAAPSAPQSEPEAAPATPAAPAAPARQKPGPKPGWKRQKRDPNREIDPRFEAEIHASEPRRAFDKPADDQEIDRMAKEAELKAMKFNQLEKEINACKSVTELEIWANDEHHRIAEFTNGELSALRMAWLNKKASLEPHSVSQRAMAARGQRYARQQPIEDDGLDIPDYLRRPMEAAE